MAPAGEARDALGNLRGWTIDPNEDGPGFTKDDHELRHSCASLAIASGANVLAVQRLLGHATASMTLDRYGHLFSDDLTAVAKSLDAALRAVLG